MNTELLVELEECMILCKRMEDLLQMELDELHLSVTGEIHDAYASSVHEMMQSIAEMKHKITLLHSCL